jgi:drug/metabolite transporter (DMT)-like permease
MVATSPFWMAGVEAAIGSGERLTIRTLTGLLVGFAGIVVLVWPELTLGTAESQRFLLGVVLLQLASFGWSLGSSYSRRHARSDHVLGTTALQMLAGGIMLGALGLARGEWSQLSLNSRTASALLYLATIGAIGGFVAYTYALRHLPVSFVSLYAYINPIIAVALGVTLLGEPFNLRIAVAAALVLVGVGIVKAKTTTANDGSTVSKARRIEYGRAGEAAKTAVRD